MRYHVMITQDIPLREHSTILFSGFIESNKTAEEIEKDIIEFNKKKGRTVKVVIGKEES